VTLHTRCGWSWFARGCLTVSNKIEVFYIDVVIDPAGFEVGNGYGKLGPGPVPKSNACPLPILIVCTS